MQKPSFFFAMTLVIASYHCCAQSTSRMTVYFDSDKSVIRNDAKDSLQAMLRRISSSEFITQIEISAHCDGRGTVQYNEGLSGRRASAIEEYLRKNGIRPDIAITKQSLGETALLNADQTTEEQAMNRRAEIVYHLTSALVAKVSEKEETIEVKTAIIPKKDTVITVFDPSKYDSIKVGDQLVLKNINFQPGRRFLLESSIPDLQKLLKVMKDHPTLKIEIQGHICCIMTGGDGPDLDLGTDNLSEERAKTVYNHLIQNGIKKSRLSYVGLGSEQKLYPSEKTERERSLNRRVEIKIISK